MPVAGSAVFHEKISGGVAAAEPQGQRDRQELRGKPVIVGGAGFLISYAIYYKRMLDMSSIISSNNPLYKLLLNRYYEPTIGADIIGVKLTHGVVAQSGEFVDRKIIDGLVIDSVIGKTAFWLGETARRLQTGVVQNYASVTLLGVGLLLLLLKFGGF